MTESKPSPSRRDFLKTTGTLAATSALAGVAVPAVHAAEDNTIRLALIGCGGRGTGAAANALATQKGPVKLVAMADVFKDKLDESFEKLKEEHCDKVEVCDHNKFIGFDGYQKAMDCLKEGDVAILTTPPAFRWVQFAYAIQKGLHTFMEKPITVDGPTTRKMLALGEEAKKKNLKVGVGLMCRHCEAREELFQRIQDGQIGDVVLLRAYRQTGPVGKMPVPPKTDDAMSELLYQVQQFHGFLWASGGCYSDFLIHNIDESCWMKDAWPTHANGTGARTYRGTDIDQNFDTYSVEYSFADGAKLFLEGRNITGCKQEFASYVHGTKGSAIISTASHTPAKCRIYKGQKFTRDEIVWAFPQPELNPYQLEWDHLMNAIRKDKLYNEVRRGAEASLVTSMGRMAAHTGQTISFDDMLNCPHEFAPDVDKLTFDSPAPLQMDASAGHYPYPQPGILRDREF